jgi:hypothetical protein
VSVTYVTQAPAPAMEPALPAPAPANPAAAAKMVLATSGRAGAALPPGQRPRRGHAPGQVAADRDADHPSARYATGTARTPKGITQLLLTPTRHIAPGRYSTLTLSAHEHKTVRTAVVMA